MQRNKYVNDNNGTGNTNKQINEQGNTVILKQNQSFGFYLLKLYLQPCPFKDYSTSFYCFRRVLNDQPPVVKNWLQLGKSTKSLISNLIKSILKSLAILAI